MNKFSVKNILALGFILALVAGCASVDTDEDRRTDVDDDMAAFDGTPAERRHAAAAREAERLAREQEEAERHGNVFYFGFDQSTLTPEARRALDAHIARLRNTRGTIRLEGHTDERGSREYNIALGERRAKAVADYMVLNGISRDRIVTVSYGEERPAELGQNEEAWSKNRRVELK